MRGYGESSAPPGEFAPHEDLAGLLHSLGVERAALVGASLGGKVAIDAALAYPDLVSGLVLVGAVPEGFSTDALIDAFEAAITPALTAGDLDRAAQISLLYFLVGPRREPEQVAPDVRQRAQVMARRTLERLTSGEPGGHHRPLDPPAINRLVDLRLPTLVIAGDLDHPEHLAGFELLAAGISGARKVGIPGTAHLPSLERPDEFNRVVLEFLAELPA